jgi:hypothetical protein
MSLLQSSQNADMLRTLNGSVQGLPTATRCGHSRPGRRWALYSSFGLHRVAASKCPRETRAREMQQKVTSYVCSCINLMLHSAFHPLPVVYICFFKYRVWIIQNEVPLGVCV